MRGIKRICIILATIFCIMIVFSFDISIVQARPVSSSVKELGDGTEVNVGSFTNIVADILGLLRLLTGLLSIIVIAYTGFQMVMENADGKKKIKERMTPLVIGVVLVFMATTIATFIVGTFENKVETIDPPTSEDQREEQLDMRKN